MSRFRWPQLLFLAIGLFVLAAPAAHAQTVVTKTLDFDDATAFPDRMVLDDVNLGGVTFSTVGSSVPVEVYRGNRRDAFYRSSNASIGAIDVNGFSAGITAVFDKPSSFVSIWGGDAGVDIDIIAMDVYDAPTGGNKLQTVVFNGVTAGWNGNPYKHLEYVSSSRNIRRILLYRPPAAAPHNLGVAWDDLSFDFEDEPLNTAPEPSSAILLLPVLGLLSWFRRRGRC